MAALCKSMRTRSLIALVSIVALIGLIFYLSSSETSDLRNNIPAGIDIDRTEHVTAYTSGFGGPGDFYVKFAVFALSKSTADEIREKGISFFKSLKCCSGQTSEKVDVKYPSWTSTPGPLETWYDHKQFPRIIDYLLHREMEVELPRDQLEEAQTSLSAAGSFLGSQSHGYLLIDPNTRKIYYFYAN